MECADRLVLVGLLALAASLTVSAVVLGVAERQALFDHGAPLFFLWHRCNVGLLASLVGVTVLLLCSGRSSMGNIILWIVCLGNILTLLWGWAMMFLIAQLADTIYVLTPAACGLNTVALVCAAVAGFKMKEPLPPSPQHPLPDVSV
jgi:hypothetical protein